MDTHDSRVEQREPASRQGTSAAPFPGREPFLTAQLKQRLDLILHLAASSDRIPLITGVHGSGKSTLKGLLLQQAPAEWEVCCVEATPMLQRDQLIQRLCRGFSAREGGVEQLLPRFADLRQAGRLPVIIVDDAEQMPVDALAELLGIHSPAAGRSEGPALVLFAAPGIDDLLRATDSTGAEQQLQRLDLLPLEREESDRLVRHLSAPDGAGAGQPISNAECEKIFLASGGLPAGIRQQVETKLQHGAAATAGGSRKRTARPSLLTDVSAPVLFGGGVLALLLLLTLVYEDEINAVFEGDGASRRESGGVTDVDEQRPPPGQPEPQPLWLERDEITRQPVLAPIELPPRAAPAGAAASAGSTLPPAPPAAGRGGADEQKDAKVRQDTGGREDAGARIDTGVREDAEILEGTGIGEEAGVKDDDKAAVPVKPPHPQLPPALDGAKAALPGGAPVEPVKAAPAALAEATGDPASAQAVPAEPAGRGAPVTSPAEMEQADPPSAGIPTLSLPGTKAKAEKRGSAPAPVTDLSRTETQSPGAGPGPPVTLTTETVKPSPAPVVEGGVRREAWLLRQPPDSYTLQLIAVGDAKAVPGFIRRHRLQEEAAWFQTTRQGQPWFPVLYGSYPSRDAAVAAIPKLPRELVKRGVWPRSLASVQQAIRDRGAGSGNQVPGTGKRKPGTGN